jgi:hypothetical protein
MKTRTTYPQITSVKPLADRRLLVGFDNGITKIYDCTPLLEHEPFRRLSDDVLFRGVKADPHGYGVVWTDEIDLAESELWLNGEAVDPDGAGMLGHRDVGSRP